MAIHLLLAVFPQFNEQKRVDLFKQVHLQWLSMYIGMKYDCLKHNPHETVLFE